MIPDLIAALRSRWRLELGIVLLALLLVALWIATTPRTYVATASLLFDTPPPSVDEKDSRDDDSALLGTQADIIKSQAVATEVVRNQGLASKPGMAERWRASGGTGDINAWLGRQLLGGVSVQVIKGSQVVYVSYASSDPQFATQMADAFADTFVRERLRLQTAPAKAYARWFEDRTSDVRTRLEQAQARLADFQRRSGIVDSGAFNAEANRLTDLSGMLTSAEASAAEAGAQAGVAGSSATAVQNSPVVQTLRAQVAAKTAAVNELRSIYGPNHPEMQAAQAELDTLNAKLSEAVGRASQTLRAESGAASTKAAALRSKLDSQRGRMLGLTDERSELDILQKDVDSARAAYDAVTQRLGTIRLQSEVPSTNARKLDDARTPLFPVSPNVPLRLLLGLVLGLLLAAGLVIFLELLKPRVRTEAGLTESTGVPVLARVDFHNTSARQLRDAA